jgi:DNA-binding NarL/FixJ family response regulator
MGRTRVLLAEDHQQVAQQLREILETECEVLAVVSDGYTLVDSAKKLLPDVVVTDIGMPGIDGLRAAEILIKSNPLTRIVVVTVHNDPVLAKKACEIGILGYVVKFSSGTDLLPAVHAAVQGARFEAESAA